MQKLFLEELQFQLDYWAYQLIKLKPHMKKIILKKIIIIYLELEYRFYLKKNYLRKKCQSNIKSCLAHKKEIHNYLKIKNLQEK